MEDLLKRIAAAEGLDIKVVAKIFKAGYDKRGDILDPEINLEVSQTLSDLIYKN